MSKAEISSILRPPDSSQSAISPAQWKGTEILYQSLLDEGVEHMDIPARLFCRFWTKWRSRRNLFYARTMKG